MLFERFLDLAVNDVPDADCGKLDQDGRRMFDNDVLGAESSAGFEHYEQNDQFRE